MQASQRYALVAIFLMLATLAADHVIGQVLIGRALPLRISDFPTRMGSWTVVYDRPTDDYVADITPTAQMRERTYKNAEGRTLDFLLVTAARYGDIHQPEKCFGFAGWNESALQMVRIGDQNVRDFKVWKDGRRSEVAYWRPSYYKIPISNTRIAHAIYAVCECRGKGGLGQSLLVRVVAPDTPQGHADLIAFIQQIQPPLRALRYQSMRT